MLRFESNPFAADAVRLRRWCDRAVDDTVAMPDLGQVAVAMSRAWVG